MGKRNLILYPSQWAALQQLDDQQLGRVMRQALGYAFDEVEPENKEVAFLFLKAQIDVDAEKYEDKCQQSRDAARSRWMQKDANGCDRIQADATAYGRTKRNADYAKEKEKEKENNNEKEKENIEKNTSSFGVSTKKEGFKKPSPAEVHDYVTAQGYSWDSSSFYDYYESNGWKVGKNTMKDWRAAVRNWNRQEQAKAQQYGVHERARANQRGEGAVPDWSKTTEADMQF